jgi:Uri superfamily endonuclease
LGKKGLAIKGFGSSDCKCESHLFRVQDYEFLREYMDELAL